MKIHRLTAPYDIVSDIHIYLEYYEIKHTYKKLEDDSQNYIFLIECTDEQFAMVADFASQLLHTL